MRPRSIQSREFVTVRVTANVPLDGQAVAMAVVPAGSSPGTGDWKTAAWVGAAGTRRAARVLVGPGGVLTLTVGEQDVWVRITDSPEAPAIRAGSFTAF